MITLDDLTKVTDGLPEKGAQCLVYSTAGGFSVARFTDINSTYGYHYKEAWFCKSGRQLSKKTVVAWVGLEGKPE